MPVSFCLSVSVFLFFFFSPLSVPFYSRWRISVWELVLRGILPSLMWLAPLRKMLLQQKLRNGAGSHKRCSVDQHGQSANYAPSGDSSPDAFLFSQINHFPFISLPSFKPLPSSLSGILMTESQRVSEVHIQSARSQSATFFFFFPDVTPFPDVVSLNGIDVYLNTEWIPTRGLSFPLPAYCLPAVLQVRTFHQGQFPGLHCCFSVLKTTPHRAK